MSRPVFNRPVEYDPSLLRQQQQLQAQQQTMSRPVSREQAMKNEFGFDVEEKTAGGSSTEYGSTEQSGSRIHRLDEDEDDAAADEEELERLAEQVQAAREAQMVSTHQPSTAQHYSGAAQSQYVSFLARFTSSLTRSVWPCCRVCLTAC